LDWRLGPGKVGHKNAKTPTCKVSQGCRQTGKKVFSVGTRRLAESVEGLNISLALAAGELWPKAVAARGENGRKGCEISSLVEHIGLLPWLFL